MSKSWNSCVFCASQQHAFSLGLRSKESARIDGNESRELYPLDVRIDIDCASGQELKVI